MITTTYMCARCRYRPLPDEIPPPIPCPLCGYELMIRVVIGVTE